MRPIETRIDLDGVEERGVPLQVAAHVGEAMGMLSPDRPAGDAEVNAGRQQIVWNIRVQPPSLCMTPETAVSAEYALAAPAH